jgi:hypothetical protein
VGTDGEVVAVAVDEFEGEHELPNTQPITQDCNWAPLAGRRSMFDYFAPPSFE